MFVATARQGLPGWPCGSLNISQPYRLRKPGVKSPSERRRSERFSIQREVRYKVFKKRRGSLVGSGKTINISSSGVLFTSDEVLRLGERLELSISWPVRLDNKNALKLVVLGTVVRVTPGCTAMQIRHHEFHTQSSISH
jgi:hypothetical protein